MSKINKTSNTGEVAKIAKIGKIAKIAKVGKIGKINTMTKANKIRLSVLGMLTLLSVTPAYATGTASATTEASSHAAGAATIAASKIESKIKTAETTDNVMSEPVQVATTKKPKADKAATTAIEKPIFVQKSNPTFVITVKANPTTGYQWFLADNYDTQLLTPLKQEYVAPNLEKIGAGGYDHWTFRVTAKAFAVPHWFSLTL